MVLPLGDLERTRITPYATYVLIALNALVYLVQLELGDEFTIAYAATPYEITHGTDIHHEVEVSRVVFGKDSPVVIRHAPVPLPVWLTLVTAMFLHGSPLHLAGNMLYLWIFGDNVEEVLGKIRYVLIYMTCGIIGMLAQVIAEPQSKVPVLGASGAIAGVMGMYVAWFPHNRVRVLVIRFITELPALAVIGGWIAIQVWAGIGAARLVVGDKTAGVAYLAHVGGAASGLIFAALFRPRASALREQNRRPGEWRY